LGGKGSKLVWIFIINTGVVSLGVAPFKKKKVNQMNKESKRNKVAQRIVNQDGTTKTIFHEKKWPVMSRKQA
jgi:hypothetical protein